MFSGRLAIIGVVGVLAVGIGVAVGSFLLTTRAVDVGSGAAYVPADAPLFVAMRLEPSAAQDGALREMLGHFPPIEGVDLDQPLYSQLVARVDEMLVEEGAGVSWADDVAPWFDGHVAIAVTEIPASAMTMPVDPMAIPEVPPTVVLLGVSDGGAAEAGIERLLAEAGDDAPTFTETEHNGVRIRSAEGSETGAYALTDDQVIIGSDAEAVVRALDTHAEGSGTLAEMAEMTKLTETLPEDWLVFAAYDLTDLMADALAEGTAASPEIAAGSSPSWSISHCAAPWPYRRPVIASCSTRPQIRRPVHSRSRTRIVAWPRRFPATPSTSARLATWARPSPRSSSRSSRRWPPRPRARKGSALRRPRLAPTSRIS